jgi:hypothetical protein
MQDKLSTFRSVCSYVSALLILLIGYAQDRYMIAKVRNLVSLVFLRFQH